MLDAVSLDQLRTFIAAVDEGSFSAASRKLLRSQSVVSEAIGNLEEQIGVQLFDRSGRYPKLTAAGSVILRDARSIITSVDLMKARAKGMSRIAEATGLGRESLYKALSQEGNPEFATVLKVVHALGLKLKVVV